MNMFINPFEEEYIEQQLLDFNSRIKTFNFNEEEASINKDFSVPKNYIIDEKENSIIVESSNQEICLRYQKKTFSRLDGYMYKNLCEWGDFPILLENNQVWMSITPMEIASHFLPIEKAHGRVGVAGLGLGYYIQNILDKEEVSEVIVYEINSTIIDLYKLNFGIHPKLTIINEDVLEIKNEHFDFFYNDIYTRILSERIAKDYQMITSNNQIELYWFWCLSAFIINSRIDNIDIHNYSFEWIKPSLDLFIAFLNSKHSRLFQKYNVEDLSKKMLNFLD